MGRKPCCSKREDLNRGAWTAHEDITLTNYIHTHGEIGWRSLPKKAGLNRCGKSCRLRWLNYLRPDIKRGNISPDEEDLIIRMHRLLGNRWALIAGRLPGRTDNEIKNYWNTHLSKKLALSTSTAPMPTTHVPLQKSHSFPGMEKLSPPSQNYSEDDGDKHCKMRSASDNEMSSDVLGGMMQTSIGDEEEAALDVSRSWRQLLEESLLDEDSEVVENQILSSSNLNDSYPVESFDPLSFSCIDFGVELEDIYPVQITQNNPSDNIDHSDCLATYNAAEQAGIADKLQQGNNCAEQMRQMELGPLDPLFYYEKNWEDSVDMTALCKSSEEEYLDILVDIPN
ncbi:hypothetical protein KI387_015702 [Taxus chinensis]|uniref:Uncharacterized protein n=1 Tax=Taxus chinensis TaxID=29808 RepID=A0AA38LDD2_TAXCH|nr:hypothetical protein KI387_015702 [Taxus chinensis]